MPSVAGQFLASEPNVPKLTKIDLDKEQQAAITANKNALPGALSLASSVNKANLDEWLKAIRFAFPQFDEAREAITGNALAMARGEIPQSDRNILQIRDAAKAYGGGYSGSGMQGALTARDLGRTTLDTMMHGQNALQSWMSSLKTPQPFDFTSMFITPQQRIAFDFQEREAQFQRDYMSNMFDAQYSWGSRAGRAADNVADAVISIMGSYVGGMGK